MDRQDVLGQLGAAPVIRGRHLHSLITTVQRVDALLALPFGLGFVLAPGLVLALYGVAPDPARVFLAQLLGAAVLGYVGINWVSVTTLDEGLRRAVVASELAFDVPAVVVCVIAVASGVMNVLGWPVAAIFALLLLARASYLVAARHDRTAASAARDRREQEL